MPPAGRLGYRNDSLHPGIFVFDEELNLSSY